MNERVRFQPRLIRPVQDPIGLYVRVGRGDARTIQSFLEIKGAHFHGVVIDATRTTLDKELRGIAANKKFDVILDPKTQESAYEGAFNEKLGKLPWGVGRPHVLSDFQGAAGRRRVTALAEFVRSNGFTKVLAPSHLIRDVDDEWLDIDLEVMHELREALDRLGASNVEIIHSLALPYSVLRDLDEFQQVVDRIRDSIADELWLKAENFGSDASPTAIRNYIEAARTLHGIEKPIIADHVGGLAGLALVAFGGVGGLAHGITLRERFSSAHWKTQADKANSFGPHHRVYIPELDMHLKPKDVRDLFDRSSSLKVKLACKDPDCCARGTIDMLQQPGSHFLNQRVKQIKRLSEIPTRLRASTYVEENVRTASDAATAISTIRIDDAFIERVKRKRVELDALRKTLKAFIDRGPSETFSVLPETRTVREAHLDKRQHDRRPGA